MCVCIYVHLKFSYVIDECELSIYIYICDIQMSMASYICIYICIHKDETMWNMYMSIAVCVYIQKKTEIC